MVRFLAAALALLALVAIAVLMPVVHTETTLTGPSHSASVAKPPAWPVWAHPLAARAAAATAPQPVEHMLGAPAQTERLSASKNVQLARSSVPAGLPRQDEQRLWLSVSLLHGVTTGVATPPPRFG